MFRNMLLSKNGAGLLLSCLLAMLVTSCGQLSGTAGEPAARQSDGMPVQVSGELKPGLATVYFFEKFGHIDEMPRTDRGIDKFGQPGTPIFKLDNRFGDGDVFDSGRRQKVGILMRGFLKLDLPGTYQFQANSNDGFAMAIDGDTVVSDPTVHSDRLSEPGNFNVVKGGFFPVEIRYFQRKGTATIELYWQPPGSNSYSIVPAEVYFHTVDS